jgi:hypothetical protein
MNHRELRNIGRYQVRRFISEGGMAWVFEVEDPTFEGRHLALKMLKPEAAAGDQFRRFESEARLLAAINHPNLVTIFDMGTDEETGCYYYTMTLVDGPPLSERGVLPVEEATPIFLEVLAGLATLHDRGIVHRDIKPANILLHSDGRAVLADLGIARVENQASDLTKTMMAIGTVRYMSPEQARGRKVGPSSDVLSVGLTYYQAITGRSVYDTIEGIDSSSGQSILFYLGSMSSRSGSELPMEFDDEVPKAIRRVLVKACRFEAEDRYQNAREMRDALLDATRQGMAAGSGGVRISPTLIGGTLIGAAAAAGLVWYASTTIGQGSAEAAMQDIAAVQSSASEILERTEGLSPPVSMELLESLRKRIDRGAVAVEMATDKINAGNHTGAADSLDDAANYYRLACSELLDGDLQTRTDDAVSSAQARVSAVDSAESRDLLPDQFAELDRLLAGLDPPDSDLGPCEQGTRQFARLETSGAITTGASLLDQDLQTEWPRQAAQARQVASDALADASRVKSSLEAYTLPMAEGRDAMASGDAATLVEDHLLARRSYGEAREAFEVAARVAPAARARETAIALFERSDAELRSRSLVKQQRESAEELFSDQHWDEAVEGFDQLATLLRNLTADQKSSAAALAAADASETLRTAALREGAASSASEVFEAAEDAHQDAVEALGSNDWKTAERGFGKAQSHYAQAKREATKHLAKANKEARRTADAGRKAVPTGDCDDLGGPARAPCQEARDSEELGKSALAERNAIDAIQSLKHARNRYDEAAKAQTAFEKNRAQPPFLVSHKPTDKVVRAYRNTPVEFRVEVDDPNPEDKLTHVWRVDGKKTGKNKPRFTYRGDRDARVTVTVDDGHGGQVEQAWKLAFRNRKPELRLSPSGRNITMRVGEKKEFHARGKDPDGEDLRYSFRLNGRQVSTRNKYTFKADKPGRYEIAARAIDGGGASASSTIKVRVKAVEKPVEKPAEVAKVEPPKPEAKPEPKPKPKPKARPKPVPPKTKKATKPSSDSRAGAASAGRAVLREYESAYEARDVARMGRVYIMNRNQKQAMGAMFNDTTSVNVEVEIVGVTVENESVYIDFNQSVSSEGKARLSGKTAHMTATVIPQGGGRWIISSILPRN